MAEIKKFKRKSFSGNRTHSAKKVKSASAKGYDMDWRSYRIRFLYYNKTCYACGATGKLHVDHVIAHKGDMLLFKKLDNHIPLCDSCHSVVTSLFDRHAVPRVQEKLEWLVKQRAKNSITSSVKVLAYYAKGRR